MISSSDRLEMFGHRCLPEMFFDNVHEIPLSGVLSDARPSVYVHKSLRKVRKLQPLNKRLFLILVE
jgi:hypothetical protein